MGQAQFGYRLDGFHADFTFALGDGFADPDRASAHGIEWILIQNGFHHLAAPQMETAAQPEPVSRGIEVETGEPFLVSVQIDNQAVTRFGEDVLKAAAFGNGKAGHSFGSSAS